MTEPGEGVREYYRQQGVERERLRWCELLEQLGVIRDGMLGAGWQVIYTQDGAVDVTWDQLFGKVSAEDVGTAPEFDQVTQVTFSGNTLGDKALYQAGVNSERERIIKLLEKQKTTHEEKIAQWSEASLHRYQELELAIALIKGEQN